MLEHADASEMCISAMTVILMSLGVTTANFKVAELFCRNRFGDSAVDIGFEHGIVADYAAGWMNDNVDMVPTIKRANADDRRKVVSPRDPSLPPIWSQRQPNSLVREELGRSQSRCTTIGEAFG